MRFATLLLAALVGLASVAPAAASDGKPPVELFFKNPKFTQVSISPTGRYIAALAPPPGNARRNIMLLDLQTKERWFATGLTKDDIVSYFWKTDGRIVFVLDNAGNENFGLYSVKTKKGSPIEDLISSKTLEKAGSFRRAGVIDALEGDPKHVIIQFNLRDVFAPDVYKLNVENGKLDMLVRNPGKMQGFETDHDGVVRIAQEIDGLKTRTLYRSSADAPWQTLVESVYPAETWGPITFDYDNRTLFVSSNVGHDMAALYKYDPETKQFGEKIFADPAIDGAGPIMWRPTKKWVGIAWQTDKVYRKFHDPEAKKLFDRLDAQFPGLEVNITSFTDDGSKMIVVAASDRDPGTYYIYDAKADAFTMFSKARPDIDPAQMSPHVPFSFKTRDGLTVHGYYTKPKDAKGPVPLLVNPHGGPYGVRDSWGYYSDHQFFASRGYATIQVNYRGSGGYGRSFYQAGFKKWGREMQNDLTDAVKWAVDQGIADPKRVCIYGGSYGGYATMAGMTFTPELYRCGINIVGVVDIPLLYTSAPAYWKPILERFKVEIGDPEADKQMLYDASPINFVKNIRAPVFIVQGKSDPRVVPKHAEWLRSEMEKHDKPYEWMMKENEGHGFRKEENRIELYKEIDAFLAKHL